MCCRARGTKINLRADKHEDNEGTLTLLKQVFIFSGSPLIFLLLSCKVLDHFNRLGQLDNRIKKRQNKTRKKNTISDIRDC